jgi:hypothetical protein
MALIDRFNRPFYADCPRLALSTTGRFAMAFPELLQRLLAAYAGAASGSAD